MDQKKKPIISTDALLSKMVDEPNLVILDCSTNLWRSGGEDDCRLNYLRKHIKKAKFLDLENLRDMRTDLP